MFCRNAAGNFIGNMEQEKSMELFHATTQSPFIEGTGTVLALVPLIIFSPENWSKSVIASIYKKKLTNSALKIVQGYRYCALQSTVENNRKNAQTILKNIVGE